MMAKIQWISAEAFHERLTPRHWRRVLLAFGVCMLPLLYFFPLPVSVLLVQALFIKWIAVMKVRPKWALFSLTLIFPLSLLLAAQGFWRYGISQTFMALLALMSACKLLEARNVRDTRILFLIQLVLMLSFLTFSQSMLIFLYLLFALGISFSTLLFITQRDSRIRTLGGWRSVSVLLLLVLPFATVIFFLFPRLDPIWGLPRQSSEAVTGLPDEMNMNGLSSLAQSDEISFRVQFEDDVTPRGEALYWRGPVLWFFDGSRWQQRRADFGGPRETLAVNGQSRIRYTLTTAKAELEWLPALEISEFPSQGIWGGRARQMYLGMSRRGEQRFTLQAATDYRLGADGALPQRDRQDATQLPEGLLLPRTRALAQNLYAVGGNSTAGFAAAFLDHIRNNEFYYTLEPLPGAENVENFLFGSGFGFCQHYANAMTLAARSIGIPARVVIGYQGGSFNPLTGYFVVREENAHAWVELWQEDRGWTRYDPTAAVAPWRVQNGSLSGGELGGNEARSAFSRYAERYAAISWLRNVSDATRTFWQNWVVNLGSERQNSLFGSLQWLGISANALTLFIAAAVFALLILLWRMWEKRPQYEEDELARSARRLLKRLEKRGLKRQRQESLAVFLRRLATERRPSNAADFLTAADSYEALRFRECGDNDVVVAQLKRLRFKTP